MINITVDLWPFGLTELSRNLGKCTIVNNGSGSKNKGNYIITFYDKSGRLWKEVRVEGFPRQRLLAWDLLYRALKEAIGDRNK